MTQIYINKTYTNIGHKIFEELVPSVSPLLKKHIRLGHAGIVDHSVDLSMDTLVSWTIPSIYQYQILKKYKKRNGQKQ